MKHETLDITYSKPLTIVEINDSSEITIPNDEDSIVYVQYNEGKVSALGFMSITPLLEDTNQLKIDLSRTQIYSGRLSKKPSLYILLPVTALVDVTLGTFWLIGEVATFCNENAASCTTAVQGAQ